MKIIKSHNHSMFGQKLSVKFIWKVENLESDEEPFTWVTTEEEINVIKKFHERIRNKIIPFSKKNYEKKEIIESDRNVADTINNLFVILGDKKKLDEEKLFKKVRRPKNENIVDIYSKNEKGEEQVVMTFIKNKDGNIELYIKNNDKSPYEFIKDEDGNYNYFNASESKLTIKLINSGLLKELFSTKIL